jgi:hypothetical protein
MRLRLIIGLAVAVAIPVAPAAAAPIVDSVQVGVPKTSTRKFSPQLGVFLKSPGDYTRGCCYDSRRGQWTGPNWTASNGATDASHIDWSVSSIRSSRSIASLARAGGRSSYPQVSAGRVKVSHLVGGRKVGTLKGYQALDGAPAPEAAMQQTLAIDIGGGFRSLVFFEASDPAVDSDPGLGSVTVNGMSASAWNRRQAQAAMRNVTVVGNLPPRRVNAKARGRGVTGKVVDRFGHPVAEIQVALRRGSRTVAKALTTTRGTFSLAASKAGKYRVLATLSGSKAQSKTLNLR